MTLSEQVSRHRGTVIVCPVCGSLSTNPGDVANSYCGACCAETGGEVVVLEETVDALWAPLTTVQLQEVSAGRVVTLVVRDAGGHPTLVMVSHRPHAAEAGDQS